MSKSKFISPYDHAAPKGAEGWRELYPYYMLFQDNLKETEENKFFYCDSQHWPNVFKPFDAITVEFAVKCLSQYNTRQWLIPPANGIDFKFHNGYCYMSPVAVEPEKIADRVPQFMERAGYYFQNWDTLLEKWHKKVKGVIDEMEAVTFEPLPEVVDMQWVKDGVGLDPTYHLIQNYDKMIDLCYKTWMYHFEFLNLGYAAYLDFFGFCKEIFPGIPDLSIAKMVQGVEVDLLRPDEELKKLAKLAQKLQLQDIVLNNDLDKALEALKASSEGKEWINAWEEAKYPWFNFTIGNGFYSTDKYWIEHLYIPFGYIQDYLKRLLDGEVIDRPTEAIEAERDRIIEEYRDSIPDPETQEAFDGKLGLARVVFPYVENHNFYIEHWAMCVFWRKMRELSQVFVNAGFFKDINDMFYFRREEIHQLLFDYGRGWAMGVPSIGPDYIPNEVARRKKIVDALSSVAPQPAFNKPPEVITEPFTLMLYGITSESVDSWLKSGEVSDELKGMAAS
ncbi:hypothetical protein, partial [Maribacter sp. 4G9]|uniref:hypothetical protein n=1 Tax=Maribacter sp. 4G9 TaxID=1889777 RepID=UPI000C15B21C